MAFFEVSAIIQIHAAVGLVKGFRAKPGIVRQHSGGGFSRLLFNDKSGGAGMRAEGLGLATEGLGWGGWG